MSFLPISKKEVNGQVDFVYVIGDAYVDHPSFGHAIISRVLESHGYSVGIISQHAQCLTACTRGSSVLGVSARGRGVQCLVDPRGPLSALCPGGWEKLCCSSIYSRLGPTARSSSRFRARSLGPVFTHTHPQTCVCVNFKSSAQEARLLDQPASCP